MITPTETLLEAFRRMLLIRIAEDRIAQDFRENKIFSFLHLCTGQEGVAVGVAMGLEPEDKVFGNHRSHGHYLAKGGDLYRMLAEIYGKADGCCRGRGGSMHMLDRSVGFMGSTPILGSVVPIAMGSAFAQKVRKEPRVTAAFFGDGASEEGVVYESLNLAAVERLPMIFVLEDNLYAVSTAAEARRSPEFSIASVAAGLGVQIFAANGNAFDSTRWIVARAREHAVENGPVLIHARAFRHMAHSGPIRDESARTFDSAEVRQQSDPIAEIMERLRERGVPSSTTEAISEEITQQVVTTLNRAKTAEAA